MVCTFQCRVLDLHLNGHLAILCSPPRQLWTEDLQAHPWDHAVRRPQLAGLGPPRGGVHQGDQGGVSDAELHRSDHLRI